MFPAGCTPPPPAPQLNFWRRHCTNDSYFFSYFQASKLGEKFADFGKNIGKVDDDDDSDDDSDDKEWVISESRDNKFERKSENQFERSKSWDREYKIERKEEDENCKNLKL
jgi:hypothetical protein